MKHYQIVIVGAGFSGLCLGIKLKQAGIEDFVILEKAADLGGTWRDNTYPGAECDIPSALYSYSFEHNDQWEYKWSGQKQILKYQHDTAEKYGLMGHIQFAEEVSGAEFDERDKLWRIATVQGRQLTAQHFVTAVGQLHHPATPHIDDAQNYAGVCFHSARWDHTVNLDGKRVAVIGNAASAVQFIPEIAERVKQLTVFQRSPNWMLPKLDRPYAAWEQRLSSKFPLLTRIYRFSIWMLGEWVVLPAIRGNRFARWAVKKVCLGNLHKYVKDPELRNKLTPDYPVGAKRILFCETYYPALLRENVSLELAQIDRFTEHGLRTVDGRELSFDVVIYATGFKTNPFLAPMKITGTEGRLLSDIWRDGAHAYLGVSTHGFPNMHMLYGPNTNLGHSSIIIMAEAQANYVVQAVTRLKQEHKRVMDVKQSVEQAYNTELQSRLADMAFNLVDESWYKDGNKITNNWAGGTREYVRRLKHIDWSGYHTA
ncbi:MAG: NAD(P)/FAD-dependent oxidoreductase [Arenicella sp.]|nr:NAD(P)/FAD-dependent oxidoreductase [Arenicella sp.]